MTLYDLPLATMRQGGLAVSIVVPWPFGSILSLAGEAMARPEMIDGALARPGFIGETMARPSIADEEFVS